MVTRVQSSFSLICFDGFLCIAPSLTRRLKQKRFICHSRLVLRSSHQILSNDGDGWAFTVKNDKDAYAAQRMTTASRASFHSKAFRRIVTICNFLCCLPFLFPV